MQQAAYVYKKALSEHVLREDHVLQPSRLQLTYELLDACGAFSQPNSLLVSPEPSGESDLLTFHTDEYVAAVKSLSRGETKYNPADYNFSDRGDNPVSPGMYEAGILTVGASLTAARMLVEGKVPIAFSPAGGLHHAAPAYASGFCVFNDPVIAIDYFLNKGMRIAYVDIDAHHADGVQNAFYASNKVLTISLHETGQFLFPGTGDSSETGTGEGLGYAVNLPLAPYTDDQVYLGAFQQIAPPLVKAFQPDVLVTQLGADAHYLDPLSHLCLTSHAYIEIIKTLRQLCPRWLALGGGGYDLATVARLWTLAYGLMLGVELPDEVPSAFRQRYGIECLRDHQQPKIDAPLREAAQRYASASVETIKRLVFPIHNI